MAGFIGVLGDWRSRNSEFALERAANELGGDTAMDARAEVINPLDGAVAAGTEARQLLGLGLSKSVATTLSSPRPALRPGGEVVAILFGRIFNRSSLAQALSIEASTLQSMSEADILAAAYRRWGEDAFARMEGSYAGAVVDIPDRKLLLVADHFGTRPLFYGHLHGQLVFGTCLRALTALVSTRPTLNASAVRSYLIQSSGPADRSMVTGLKRLLPAQMASHSYASGKAAADPNAFRTSTYWRAGDRGGETSLPLRQALTRFREILQASTQQSLEEARSPIIGLSGGLHSSSVLLALRHAAGVRATLPVLHLARAESTPTASRYASLASREAGATFHRLEISTVDGRAIEEMARVLNGPVVDVEAFVTYRLLKEARSLGHSTILTGAGAVGGLGSNFQSCSSRLAEHLVAGESIAGLRYAWSLRKIVRPRLLSHAAIEMAWPAAENAKVPIAGTPEYFETPVGTHEVAAPTEPVDIPAYRSHCLQMALVTASELGSAIAIEHSAPLVSVELAEAANSVWARKLERTGQLPTGLLVAAMRGIVPDDILNEAAAPVMPILSEREILTQSTDWVWDTLHDDVIGDLPLQAQILRESWLLMLKGKTVYDSAVWRWINLATWARAHRVSFA